MLNLPWLEPLLNALSRRYLSGNLHHGLLISAPAGAGKDLLSASLAQSLLCQQKQSVSPCGECQSCALFRAGSHPDLHTVESEKQVGVDQIREAISKLTGTAQLSGAKVLVIHQAHKMTESAANALLKTLEEPTQNTYLMLLCDTTETVLPTILSRCEKIRLPLPEQQQTIEWLAQQGINVSPRQVDMYGNLPLMIKKREQEEGHLTLSEFFEGLHAIYAQQTLPHEIADKWQVNAEDVLNWLASMALSAYRAAPETQALWQFHLSLVAAKTSLPKPGLNKTLILSELLSQINCIPKPILEDFSRAG